MDILSFSYTNFKTEIYMLFVERYIHMMIYSILNRHLLIIYRKIYVSCTIILSRANVYLTIYMLVWCFKIHTPFDIGRKVGKWFYTIYKFNLITKYWDSLCFFHKKSFIIWNTNCSSLTHELSWIKLCKPLKIVLKFRLIKRIFQK